MTGAEARLPRLRILCLGDSYSVGEGVPVAESWPHRLVAELLAGGRDVTLRVVARTGWSVAELAAGIAGANLRPPYDLVTVQIGVNDQYRGRSVDDYRPAMASMLSQATAFAAGNAGRVIVLSIPDWSVTPHGEDSDRQAAASAIDLYNEAAAGICRERGIAWVDVTAASRRAPEELTEDGLHPSGAQYQRWVADVFLVAERLLST